MTIVLKCKCGEDAFITDEAILPCPWCISKAYGDGWRDRHGIKGMKRCATCRHWQLTPWQLSEKQVPPDSECFRIKRELDIDIEIDGDATAEVDTIYTKKEFGCTLWEGRV